MFNITCARPIEWPNFSLRKGENVFTTRKAVPSNLWPKLDRFRALGIVDFEGKAEAGGDDLPKLEELSQKQLYALKKDELVELAKGAGVLVAEDASKAVLIGELEKKLSPGAIAAPPPEDEKPAVTADPSSTSGEKVVVSNRRGGKGAPVAPSGES